MRLLSFFLQCVVLVSSVSAQTTEVFSSFFGISGNVQWFKHALDASGSGDVVVTGFSDGTIGIPGQNPALSSGLSDWFVARYNAAGNLLWFRKIGGPQYDYGMAINTDGQGNTYVGGSSNSNLAVGVSTNSFDPFVAKYDINGTQVWLRNLAKSLSVSSQGASDTTGIGQLVLDGNSVYIVARSNYYSEYYLTISRWDREVSNMEWKQVIKLNQVTVADATVDSNHNLIFVGARSDSHIEPLTPRLPRAVNQGGWDGFALGVAANGEWSMLTGQGSAGDDMTHGVAVDASNNIYVTGYVSGNYDGQLWRNQNSRPDVFITKYAPITSDGQGQRLWSRVFFPAAAADVNQLLRGIRLAVDYVGGLYLAASQQSLEPGSNAVGYFNLPNVNPNYQGLVLQKFDTNGNSVWGQRLSMANMNVAGFSFDNTGSLYISGSFNSLWNSQQIGLQNTVFGFLQKRSNPLNCSCSDLSTLVDEVASLLQISVN